ncbi:MAG: DegV family protein [Marinagarivorans sp.]|nr:DegV family protein [Marinagarivorans sp.]
MNKIAIIVDSVCSLPDRLLEKYNIIRVPITINIDGKSFSDPCSAASAVQMFTSGQLSRRHRVTTLPPTPQAFAKAIEKAIEAGAEQVFVQTLNRKQGDTYDHANTAVSMVASRIESKKVTVRVMDSRTVFSGQALMVAETLRRLLTEKDANTVRRQMDVLSAKILTYVLPKSPLIALERSKSRGERSVGWAQALIANTIGIHPILCNANDASECVAKILGFDKACDQLFRHAEALIAKGLLSPIMVLNYAGPLINLKKIPAFELLEAVAKEAKIQLIVSEMSLAGGIYSSPGSLSLSIMSETSDWQVS